MLKTIIPLLTLGLVVGAGAETKREFPQPTEEAVMNFGLLDHQGRFHELHYFANDPKTTAILLFVQGNGCPLVRKQVPELKRLRERYADRGIRFWMLNANYQDEPSEIRKEAESFEIDMPILLDSSQLVAETLGLTRTAEVLLIEADTWRIRYRGAISDRLDYEADKPRATRHYLVDALESVLKGEQVQMPKTSFAGCRISFPDGNPKEHAAISYTETIVPLLKRKCVQCHQEGGVAPWAMSSHRKVRGWAAMMEEVVLTRRMPPWQADHRIGHFSNDFSLDDDDAKALIHWIRAGAPRDGKVDPLKDYKPKRAEWVLGKPDHIIKIEPQSIPAEGVINYRYVNVKLPFEEDVWVRALEVNPGNTRVLHHIIATTMTPVDGRRQRRSLAGYAPGMGPFTMPDETGILIPAGSHVRFQLHYTASGKPETDASQLGLYFHQERPPKELRTGVVIHPKFAIPPGERAYSVSKTNTIRRDSWLFSMNPHMHYRGKAMSYEALYPDGTSEMLLSVPHYHFNWQRHYHLAEPKFLPKGTRIMVHATWDNSTLNPFNPDPAKEVRWGEQTFDEMFFASYKYVHGDKADPPASAKAQ